MWFADEADGDSRKSRSASASSAVLDWLVDVTARVLASGLPADTPSYTTLEKQTFTHSSRECFTSLSLFSIVRYDTWYLHPSCSDELSHLLTPTARELELDD